MGVLDDFMVNPNISLLDKTRIQAQVLVPVMRAMRAEIGREKADATRQGRAARMVEADVRRSATASRAARDANSPR